MRTGARRAVGEIVVFSSRGADGAVRVGLVVGKRVGTAVRRNRVKRRLRHALRRIEIADGTDLVVVAAPGVRTVAFDTLVEWLLRASKERG